MKEAATPAPAHRVAAGAAVAAADNSSDRRKAATGSTGRRRFRYGRTVKPRQHDGHDEGRGFISVPFLFDGFRAPSSSSIQRATVTRKKVAGMEVDARARFWLLNRSSSSRCKSAARPFFSAASNAFIVGP